MYSIMDAIEAAQRRTKERDQFNEQRPPLMMGAQQSIMQPLAPSDEGGRGDGPGLTDTRTEHQKYLDAIDANQYVSSVPVIGPVLGLVADSFIEDYEIKNPDKVVGGPNKFSTLGRIQGKGLTVEEQIQAEKEGIGLGKMLGLGEKKSGGGPQPGYSLFDRIFGTTPMNVAAQGDYIGVFPQDIRGDGGRDDTPGDPSGGRASMVSDDDYSGYA